jgi:hypothetical protein
MDFPEALGPRDPEPPKHIMSGAEMASSIMNDSMHDDRAFEDHSYADDPAVAMAQTSERAPEVISLDSMRSTVLTNLSTNFEQDDLDVPAFLRKRNDVM